MTSTNPNTKKTAISLVAGIAGLKPAVAILLLASGLLPLRAEPSNILENGGFEEWDANYQPPKLPPQFAKMVPRTVGNLEPMGWTIRAHAPYENEKGDNPDFPITVTISRDDKVKHSGAFSAKITNEAFTDIASIGYGPFQVSPNQTYTFKAWLKMEDVSPNPKPGDGVGVSFWFAESPVSTGAKEVTRTSRQPEPNKGTGDWQEFDYTITTKDSTLFLTIYAQLRRASGTVWFDDFELVPVDKK
jgi:hypothetical protein